MFNESSSTKAVLAVFAALVVAVAFTGGAAAFASVAVTPEDDGTGDTTTYTIDSTVADTTESNSFSTIELSHGNDIDGDSIDTAVVTLDGADVAVSEIESSSDSTQITFEEDQTLDNTNQDLIVEISDVENPDDAGDYDFGIDLTEGDGTTITSETATVSIAVGDTPSVTDTSEFSDGLTVEGFEADGANTTTMQVDSNTDNLELRVTAADSDDDAVYETFDSDHAGFTVVSEATDTEAGTYEWDIDHDELENVPADPGEMTNTTFEVENLDGDDAVNSFDVMFDVPADSDRSVAYASSAAINNADVGVDATSETDEIGGFFGIGAEEVTNYHVDEEFAINGSNSTAALTLGDEDMADAFSNSAEDADAGDILLTQTVTHDGHVALVFNEEANEDIVDTDADTYAVYDGDNDRLTLHTGEDYQDESTVNVHAGSHNALELDDVNADDIPEAVGQEFGVTALVSEFGATDGLSINSFDLFGLLGDDDTDESFAPFLLIGAGAGSAGAKRRASGV